MYQSSFFSFSAVALLHFLPRSDLTTQQLWQERMAILVIIREPNNTNNITKVQRAGIPKIPDMT